MELLSRKFLFLALGFSLAILSGPQPFAVASDFQATPVSFSIQEKQVHKNTKELLAAYNANMNPQEFKDFLDSYRAENVCEKNCQEDGYRKLDYCVAKYSLEADLIACIRDEALRNFKMCTTRCDGSELTPVDP